MKLVIAIALSFAFLKVQAAAVAPLITKYSDSGFVPVEWIRNEKCELYPDKAVITKSFGLGNTVVEVRPVIVSSSVVNLIAEASLESVETEDNFICDLPATNTTAYQTLSSGEVEPIDLYRTGGCGAPSVLRNGSASRNLRDMIALYCPKTNDFGQ